MKKRKPKYTQVSNNGVKWLIDPVKLAGDLDVLIKQKQKINGTNPDKH